MDRDFGGRFAPNGVIGGPPCQSFSRANHFRSDDDPRRKLVAKFFSIALRLHKNRRPLDFIVMENVPELEQASGGKLLETELSRLEKNGFHVTKAVLDASEYGVPQYRRRLFVVAISKDAMGLPEWNSPKASKSIVRQVSDVLSGLPEPLHFELNLKRDDIPFHPNHWCMKPKSAKFFDGSLKAGYSSGRSFKTLSWDKPSIAVSYGHREVHVHPGGHRRLSVLEAMRLQGFDDTYTLEGTLSSQIDQVSEAVPPPLAETVAQAVKLSVEPISNSVQIEEESKSSSAASVEAA